jgi:hypothetical protein
MDVARWLHGRQGNQYCKTCRAKNKQKKTNPPCTNCKHGIPEMSEEVSSVVGCFLLCQTQIRRTSETIYALDWQVVKDVAESMGVAITGHFYRLLGAYENVFLEEINKK